MINYMKRTDIISDISRGVPDSRIAHKRMTDVQSKHPTKCIL